MIFGVSESKFEYSGSFITLHNSRILPDWFDQDLVENTSVIDGSTDIRSLGGYSKFNVEVELHKYTSSIDAFNNIYQYLYAPVNFYPHSDKAALLSTDGSKAVFYLSGMKINYLNDTDYKELLSLEFISNGYTSPTSSFSVAPVSASNNDYLWFIDFDDTNRTVVSGNYFSRLYVDKIGSSSNYFEKSLNGFYTSSYFNSLGTGYSVNENNRYTLVSSSLSTDTNYTDFTFFIVFNDYSPTNDQFIFSDYGEGAGNRLLTLKVSGSVDYRICAQMRDNSANLINCDPIVETLTPVFSGSTDPYIIVAKYNGTNKRIDLWYNNGEHYYATNSLYDTTTKFAGGLGKPTLGALSSFNTFGLYGYLGSMFVTKTALSNNDINLYANWLAEKWGTTWLQI